MNEAIFNILRRFSTNLKKIFYSSHFVHGSKERLIVGKRVSLANTLFNTRSGKIVVEDGVMFSHNVMVLTGLHDIAIKGSKERRITLESAGRDVLIKKGAWIASGVIILGPVTIGENSVIGAGSVVVKNVPDGVFVSGNPAKVIKRIEFK